MKNNRSLQILVPFIVNKIEKLYDVVEEHGCTKKNMLLMVIDSLNNNRFVNLEYHVCSANPETHPVQDPDVPGDFSECVRPEAPHGRTFAA